MAKLTVKDVKAIRITYATGRTSLHKLAVEYGVSIPTIHRAITHHTWRHA